MTHVFKQSALAAVIGGALALSPVKSVNAQLPLKDNPTPAELKKAIEDTSAEVKALREDIKKLTELVNGKRTESGLYADEKNKGLAHDVHRLNELVRGKFENGVRLQSDPGVVSKVQELGDTVNQLKTTLDNLNKSQSLRPTTTTPDPMAGKGTVRVVNDYPVEISILVNNTSYHIAPRAKQDIPVAVGDFTYQLLQNGAVAKRSQITEKEVVTLRIK